MQAAPRPEQSFKDLFDTLANQIDRVLVGKRRAIHLSLVCLFSEGHLLIEDVPGVGKTSLAKAIARSIGGTWRRVQFTPDLLPSDVTGVSVWDRGRSDFEFRPGGVFANVVLADEINRASPKTQSALLEAMEERQVTVDAQTYKLPRPFLVIATQNPVELEGTYPLPEAQLDRFLLRLRIGYPDRDAEIAILGDQGVDPTMADELEPVTDADVVAGWTHELGAHPRRARAAGIHRRPRRGDASSSRPAARRQPARRARVAAMPRVRSQRASVASYVVPDDVKVLAASVLEHRLMLVARGDDARRASRRRARVGARHGAGAGNPRRVAPCSAVVDGP